MQKMLQLRQGILQKNKLLVQVRFLPQSFR
jgi:hypothetical protein